MGRRKTPGLVNRGGVWHIDKKIRGHRLCESTGENSLEKAEEYLARRIEETRKALIYGERPKRTFRQAATKYLNESQHKKRIADEALHLQQLDPFIGDLELRAVHIGTLQPFIEMRRKAGIKTKSINLALGVVRHILNVAASEWLYDTGLTWLEHPPAVEDEGGVGAALLKSLLDPLPGRIEDPLTDLGRGGGHGREGQRDLAWSSGLDGRLLHRSGWSLRGCWRRSRRDGRRRCGRRRRGRLRGL